MLENGVGNMVIFKSLWNFIINNYFVYCSIIKKKYDKYRNKYVRKGNVIGNE